MAYRASSLPWRRTARATLTLDGHEAGDNTVMCAIRGGSRGDTLLDKWESHRVRLTVLKMESLKVTAERDRSRGEKIPPVNATGWLAGIYQPNKI